MGSTAAFNLRLIFSYYWGNIFQRRTLPSIPWIVFFFFFVHTLVVRNTNSSWLYMSLKDGSSSPFGHFFLPSLANFLTCMCCQYCAELLKGYPLQIPRVLSLQPSFFPIFWSTNSTCLCLPELLASCTLSASLLTCAGASPNWSHLIWHDPFLKN